MSKKSGKRAKASQKPQNAPVKNVSKKAGSDSAFATKGLKTAKNGSKNDFSKKKAAENGKNQKNTKLDVKVPEVKEKRKNKRKIAWLVGAIVAVLLAVGVGVGVAVVSQKHEPEAPEVVEEQEPEPEEPEEPEPIINTDPLEEEPNITDTSAYTVAPYKPRYLSLPSVAKYEAAVMNIPIVEVGMWAGNQLGSPTSTRVVAWYYRSAIPGQPGTSVMDAHGGDLGTGIFKHLPKAKVGDEIIIEMGDGTKHTYIIEEMVYKKIGTEADKYMDYAYMSPKPGVPSLSLITCTGKWLRDQQTYDLRLFVRALLKE